VCRWFESDCRYRRNTVLALSVVRVPITIKSCGRSLIGIYHPASSSSEPSAKNPSATPLVVMCHGLGGDKCGRGRILVSLSEMLSKEGIASIRFDFLGSGDSEGDFSELTPEICIQNLRDVIAEARAGSLIPFSRFAPVGLFGRSFGGYICLLSSPFIEDLRAIAVQAPPFDAETFSSPLPTIQEEKGRLFFMGQAISEEFLPQMQRMDMTAALEQIQKIPLLHISCEKDVVISADHTEKFKKVRGENQILTHFEFLLEADHFCSVYKHRTIVLEKVIAWFTQFLKTTSYIPKPVEESS
jgi:uncharacterized protein